MAKSDADRWNRRYQQGANKALENPRKFLLENVSYLPKNGLILDVAMGVGRNGGWLESQGYRVVGVDISFEGVSLGKSQYPQMDVFVADLQHSYFPNDYFDGIINLYYLERSLFPKFPKMLRKGGVLLVETLLKDSIDVKPELNSDFLLESGELLSLCKGMEILKYREGWIDTRHGMKMAVASVIARRH